LTSKAGLFLVKKSPVPLGCQGGEAYELGRGGLERGGGQCCLRMQLIRLLGEGKRLSFYSKRYYQGGSLGSLKIVERGGKGEGTSKRSETFKTESGSGPRPVPIIPV